MTSQAAGTLLVDGDFDNNFDNKRGSNQSSTSDKATPQRMLVTVTQSDPISSASHSPQTIHAKNGNNLERQR